MTSGGARWCHRRWSATLCGLDRPWRETGSPLRWRSGIRRGLSGLLKLFAPDRKDLAGLDAPATRNLVKFTKWRTAQGRADDATAHSGAARDIWAELPRGSGGNIGGHRQTHPAIAQPRSRAAPAERTRGRSRAAAALGGGRLLTRAPRGWRRGELEHDCLGQLLRHTSPPSPRSRPFLLLACSGCVSSRGVYSRVLLPPLPPLPPLGRL